MRRGVLLGLVLLLAGALFPQQTEPAFAQTTPTLNSHGSYTVPGDWALIPSGLTEGDEFRLLFITNTWRDASSTVIADYDAHVQASAAGSHDGGAHAAIIPYSALFMAVGSTAAVDARTHTGTDPNDATDKDVPIYWMGGARVAANNSGFWNSTWENWANTDRRSAAGVAANPGTAGDWHWTGTQDDGAKATNNELGSTNPRQGKFLASSSDTGPFSGGGNAVNSQNHSFLGLSPVFRVGATTTLVLVSNFGQASATGADLTFQDRAQAFSTGSHPWGYTLTSFDVQFHRVSDAGLSSKMTVTVQSSQTSGVLGTLNNPTFQSSASPATYTFTAPSGGISLAPNTQYWLVFDVTSSLSPHNNRIADTHSNSIDSGGALGWGIADTHRSRSRTTTGNFTTTAPRTLKISVNGENAAGGLTFDPDPLTVTEGGSADYTVVLDAQPPSSVTVTITDPTGAVTVDTDSTTGGDQNTLTFTTGNWNAPQTVTVSAVQETADDYADDAVTLIHAAGGQAGWMLDVTVEDDDRAATGPPNSMRAHQVKPEGRAWESAPAAGDVDIPEGQYVGVRLDITRGHDKDLPCFELQIPTSGVGKRQIATVSLADLRPFTAFHASALDADGCIKTWEPYEITRTTSSMYLDVYLNSDDDNIVHGLHAFHGASVSHSQELRMKAFNKGGTQRNKPFGEPLERVWLRYADDDEPEAITVQPNPRPAAWIEVRVPGTGELSTFSDGATCSAGDAIPWKFKESDPDDAKYCVRYFVRHADEIK